MRDLILMSSVIVQEAAKWEKISVNDKILIEVNLKKKNNMV